MKHRKNRVEIQHQMTSLYPLEMARRKGRKFLSNEVRQMQAFYNMLRLIEPGWEFRAEFLYHGPNDIQLVTYVRKASTYR